MIGASPLARGQEPEIKPQKARGTKPATGGAGCASIDSGMELRPRRPPRPAGNGPVASILGVGGAEDLPDHVSGEAAPGQEARLPRLLLQIRGGVPEALCPHCAGVVELFPLEARGRALELVLVNAFAAQPIEDTARAIASPCRSDRLFGKAVVGQPALALELVQQRVDGGVLDVFAGQLALQLLARMLAPGQKPEGSNA